MDITPELSATVLDAVPAAHGQTATLHEIAYQVRREYPGIRLTEVVHVLLTLRAEGKVRRTGDLMTQRYARRV